MYPFLPFLLSNWRACLVGGVLAGALGTAAYYKHEADHYESQAEFEHGMYIAAKIGANSYRQEVEKQNASIEQLHIQAEESAAQHRQELAKVAAGRQVAQRDAKALLATPKPAGKAACDAAVDLFWQEHRK